MNEIYLDYAATSAIRPAEVAEAMHAYLTTIGATPGRSGHRRALEAGRVALRCRRALSELIGHEGDPGRITFQLNATHALNLAIRGCLEAGDRVVRTSLDHNSVRRPVAALASSGVRESVLALPPSGEPDLGRLRHLMRGDRAPARLLVVPHASNVTAAVLPVRAMADVAHEFGALVLVDAAQTVGHLPVDVEDLGADLLAFSGHKGLLGPQGTGGLWVRSGVDVQPMVAGGTGGDSAPPGMPDAYPDHLEAGTQNAPGIAGLAAGVDWVAAQGIERLRTTEHALRDQLIEGLAMVPRVRLHSVAGADSVGIATLTFDGLDAGDLAAVLERRYGIVGRAGLHCAPEAHASLGTMATGAFRLSVGWATSAAEIATTVQAFRELNLEQE